MFNVFKQNLRICLKESKQLFKNDKSIYLKIWQLNESIIKLSIPFIKSLATLKIPSLNKLEYLESFEEFMSKKDALSGLISDLKVEILSQLAFHNKNMYENEDFQNFCNNLILIIDEFKYIEIKTINERYKNFIDGLNSFSNFYEKIKKNNDTKIIFNSDDKAVENFIDKYYSLFLEYCDIMGSCDEVYLDEYLYHTTFKFGGTYKKVLEEMFFDIVVAKEMRKYLEIYQVDKTDFLIFARTDYFKSKLFDNILNNLYVVTHSLIFEKKSKGVMCEKIDVLSQEDQEFMTRIGNLYDQLDPIFNLVKKTESLLVFEDDTMSLNVHQNLFDDKNQIGNDHVKNDINRMVDEELMDSEKNKMDDNENEARLEYSSKLNEDCSSNHANLDESQETGNEQKNGDFCSETSNASFNDENLISDEEKLDESQMYNKEQIKDEINLSHVHVTNNDHRNGDEASLKEKSQESSDVKNEESERGDLKNHNLFITEETRAEENSQVDCIRNVRFRLNDEQNEKNESNPINGENFNDENKFNNDTKLNEFKPLIYKNKLTNHQHEDEMSHSKGYYIFHIILVMFATISLIGLLIFFVLDKR